MNDRRAQRQALRAVRAAIAPQQQRAAAAHVARWIAATRWLAPGRRIGLYAAVGHELDTVALLELIRQRGAIPFFPRLENQRARRMTFAPIGRRHRLNRYGIVEPDTPQRTSAAFLNIIFMPLLGFDSRGHRLGMGAGFYDRVLAFRRRRLHWPGPLLVGLAHACQEVTAIEATPTDIALDAVVTEMGIRFFRGVEP